VKCLRLPPRSPNLNALSERWVRSVKEECLSKLILFGEGSLRRALTQFQEHYLFERNHQGKGNILLFPRADQLTSYGSSIGCHRDSAVFSSITTGGPHEFFGYTGTASWNWALDRENRRSDAHRCWDRGSGPSDGRQGKDSISDWPHDEKPTLQTESG
jgi:hypothetical protein